MGTIFSGENKMNQFNWGNSYTSKGLDCFKQWRRNLQSKSTKSDGNIRDVISRERYDVEIHFSMWGNILFICLFIHIFTYLSIYSFWRTTCLSTVIVVTVTFFSDHDNSGVPEGIFEKIWSWAYKKIFSQVTRKVCISIHSII